MEMNSDPLDRSLLYPESTICKLENTNGPDYENSMDAPSSLPNLFMGTGGSMGLYTFL